jgi:DNA-binding CsgD family transcriptional regulator
VQVVGRHREQAEVDRFLDVLLEGPAALVLEGEAGIGKTTVWRAALDAARGRSCRVLICRASESESALSFIGLCDLLEGAGDDALELLPEPQRVALELALRRSAGGSPDRVGVARGALNVFRASAAKAPTVLAIDDVQWLDPPSADALRFVAHRLSDERVGLLVSARNGGAGSLELDRAFPGVRLGRLWLEPLSFEELEEVVRVHFPVSFPRPTWRALHRISGGNPFFALQLTAALERRGGRMSAEGLPIPATLADAMRERIAALSPTARRTLLPITALAQPTLALIHAGAADADGVEEAARSGVLQVDGERLRFAHPLLASFVYGDASQSERRAVHRRLAPLIADPEEHALHLARGTIDQDEAVAATLEATAGQAARRGHPEIAAELAEHAGRLTPTGSASDRARRVRKAAVFFYAAGDAHRSRELLERLIGALPRSTERAEALRLLGGTGMDDDLPRAVAHLEQGCEEANADPELRAHILTLLSRIEGFRGHWDGAARRAREAVELAEHSGSDAALAKALARSAWAEPTLANLQALERAVALERSLEEPLPSQESPRMVGGVLLLALDRLDEARHRLEEAYEQLVALGDSWRSVLLTHLAELELRAGNWQRALALARESEGLARQWGTRAGESWALATRALVEAHVGDSQAALGSGERASELARAVGFHFGLVRSETALALLKISTGDNTAAVGRLLPLLGQRDGAILWPAQEPRVLSYALEALVAAGSLEQAEALVDRLAERIRSLPLPSMIAALARGRALVLAGRGDLDGARASIEDALAAHSRLPEPFDLARTYMARGAIERRAKQKAKARAALRRAEEIFAELGARLWLERSRRELARTGLTRSFERELTPTEQRIAELAAAGSRNKEIAGALFLSVKTVEANLSRVYAKLGIRSRVELAARLPQGGKANSARGRQR